MMRSFFAALLALFASASAAGQGRTAPAVAPILTTPEARDAHSFARPEVARVTHVALDLDADFAAHLMAGTATLDIQAAPGASEIVLDSAGLDIRAVTDAARHKLHWRSARATRSMAGRSPSRSGRRGGS
jgi:leukotriene-A4 hydrolase